MHEDIFAELENARSDKRQLTRGQQHAQECAGAILSKEQNIEKMTQALRQMMQKD